MPMFKKGKSDSKDAPVEAKAAAPTAAGAHAPAERSPHRDAVPAATKAHEAPAAAGAVAQAAGPVADSAATPTPGESLLAGVGTEKVADVPAAAIDDKTTSNLMHIFTEDQEGLNANATIYEAFMEELTMEKVAANAQQLLSDLRAAK